MRSYWCVVGPKLNITGVTEEERRHRDPDTWGRMPWDHGGSDWRDVATSRGTSRLLVTQRAQGQAWNRFSLRTLGDATLLPLQSWTSVRGYISVWSHSVWVLCYGSHVKLIHRGTGEAQWVLPFVFFLFLRPRPHRSLKNLKFLER